MMGGGGGKGVSNLEPGTINAVDGGEEEEEEEREKRLEGQTRCSRFSSSSHGDQRSLLLPCPCGNVRSLSGMMHALFLAAF